MNDLAEINNILRLAGLPLLEETRIDEAPAMNRLMPMFQGIIQALPKAQELITRKINWSRRVLQREDRIIWYLRLVQAGYFVELTQDPTVGKNAEKKLDQIAAKMGAQRNSLALYAKGIESFEQRMVHYLSMPINNIQNMIWDTQTPDEIVATFKELEDDWREDQDRTVPEDEDAEIVIDFGDGYAWYNLNKPYCSAEAKAMGHCGNSPRSSSNDHIISLRRRQHIGGEDILTPVLTFILMQDGMLTEMKGRGNDKPAARYHKYIVPLLRSDIVDGIQGGGYMAENNFALDDLEEDGLADELRDEKPGLAGPVYWIEKAWEAGDYDGAAKALENLVDSSGLDYPGHLKFDLENAEKGMHAVSVELGEWSNLEEVINEYEDQPVKSLIKMRDELKDMLTDASYLDQEMDPDLMSDIIELLPREQQSKMAQELGIQDTHPAKAIADTMERQGENSPYYDMMRDAITRSVSIDAVVKRLTTMLQEVDDRIELYVDAGMYLTPSDIGLYPRDENNQIDGEWVMTISMRSLMSTIEVGRADDEDDYDVDHYQYREWRYEGIRLEDDHHGGSEHRGDYSDHKEHELVGANEDDPMWAEFDADEIDLEQADMASQAAQRLSSMLSTGMTPAMPNDRQGEFNFESEIQRIRLLAGILHD
jgi:hypothetical protein